MVFILFYFFHAGETGYEKILSSAFTQAIPEILSLALKVIHTSERSFTKKKEKKKKGKKAWNLEQMLAQLIPVLKSDMKGSSSSWVCQ